MRTKNSSFGKAFLSKKRFALVEIAIVLCSVFLVAIPAIAAEQNQGMQKASISSIITASEDDYVLDIYGNANEDDTIDMGDVVYTKLAIFGKKPKTELCDAKYDGRINVLDVIQTKLIILGKEKELTYVDILGEAETVHKPIKRIVVMDRCPAEALRTLNAKDKVVAVTMTKVAKRYIYFPELSKLPNVGSKDYEAILSQNPDALMTYIPWASSWAITKNEWKEKLPGVQIISLSFVNPMGKKWTGAGGVGEHAGLIENTRKLGYILDKEDEAEEFCDWYEGWLSKVEERTDGLSEDEKPRVYTEWYQDYRFLKGRNHQICTLAGGIDLLDDLPTHHGYVDPEWVIVQNPDIIIGIYSFGHLDYETDDPSEIIAKRENILNRPELANVAAVKNDRVYIQTFVMTNGPHTIANLAYMAKWFHPDLFEDLDPEAIQQEYLTRFQRIDYDLDKHGVFAYPPIEIDGGLAGIPDKYKGQI